MADGAELIGTPTEVIAEMRSRAFGYSGPTEPLLPFCSWLAGRFGGMVPCSATNDEAAAEWVLGLMEQFGAAVQVRGVVIPLVR